MNIKKEYLSILLILLLFISIAVNFIYPIIGGDGFSQFMPAQHLLKEGNLNLWNNFNNLYNTSYFTYPTTDAITIKEGLTYPTQTLGMILYSAYFISFFGVQMFFYINLIFSIFILITLVLIMRKLVKDKSAIILVLAIISCMPILLIWTIIPQNIIPSSFFLIFGVYSIIFRQDNFSKVLGYVSLFIAAYLRYPLILFVAIILIFDIIDIINKKNSLYNLKKISHIFLSIVLILILIVLQNEFYFDNPSYFGYLQKANLENNLINTDISILKTIFNLVIKSLYFIQGSLIIFCPFIIIYPIIALKYSNLSPLQKKYYLFVIIATIVNVIYYLTIENNLWKPSDINFQWSLALAFFRYLLPTYLLLMPLVAIPIEKYKSILKNLLNKKIFLFIIAVSIIAIFGIYSNVAINYEGGSNLNYIKEYNEKSIIYSSNTSSLLKNNSVILYATRRPFTYTFLHNKNYNWFWYDGIPVKERLNTTNRVVDELLNKNVSVYYLSFEAPYNSIYPTNASIDMYQVEEFLNEIYNLKEVPNTNFAREKATFYEVTRK